MRLATNLILAVAFAVGLIAGLGCGETTVIMKDVKCRCCPCCVCGCGEDKPCPCHAEGCKDGCCKPPKK